MQVFLFKEHINSKVTEFSCKYERIHSVAAEAGYALCDDGVHFPGTAILNKAEKLSTVSRSSAGDTPIGVYANELHALFRSEEILIIVRLNGEAVELFLTGR